MLLTSRYVFPIPFVFQLSKMKQLIGQAATYGSVCNTDRVSIVHYPISFPKICKILSKNLLICKNDNWQNNKIEWSKIEY
jgi:hypothetical protein